MNARRAPAVLALAVLMLTTSTVSAAPPRPSSVGPESTDHWIVTLRPGRDPRAIGNELIRAVGGRVEHVYRHALQGFSFNGSAAAANTLARDPNVLAVVPDRELRIVAETLPFGVKRIDALHMTQPDAHEAGFTGAGVSIGILDTGIDLDHPDLNVDVARGLNCMGAGPPDDGHGHGTHVAGTSAALRNGQGVVGVAPDAAVVPIKVLDDAGVGSDATVICGVDYLTQLATDADPTNDIDVANMSLGEEGAAGNCADGGLHQAICASVAAGVTYVVAAGNSSIDASGFVPAAYPEVITVSAMVDLDGEPGSAAGCYFFLYCDDGFAFFSDHGAVVDVIAPGVQIYSTWKGGGYQTSDGTSMASPHVAGVAALVKAANPSLSPADIQALLKARGECPDGSAVEDGTSGGDCADQGQWTGDPDGVAEPLPNALSAAAAAATWDPLPSIEITSPLDGATVSGDVLIQADASDNSSVTHVAFEANGAPVSDDTDPSDGWSATWSTAGLPDGTYNISAVALDSLGQSNRHTITVSIGVNLQGDWVGAYGSGGYVLGAWNGTSGDLLSLPAGVGYAVELGTRATWNANTSDVRALESPDQSQRRATLYWGNPVRLKLTFPTAYSGTLHVYALDWDNLGRRQSVAVSNGSTTQTINITGPFTTGAWLHFPVSVPAGGSLTITATKSAGPNAVLSGLFLGSGGPPLPPPPPPFDVAPQGDWVGAYGSGGYVLGAWNGTSGDLLSLPAGVGYAVELGTRATWNANTSDVRALESPDQSQRRATLYWGNPVRLKLTFPTAYSGTLHVYALDWDNLGRRQSVAVSNGSTTQTINITGPFTTGAWLHFPVSVPAGGSLTITATKSAGPNAVLSGLFLGSGGPPLPPPPPPFDVAPQGDWVGAYGSGGYVLGAWNGTSGDLLSLPAGVGYAVELGTRATWNANTSDVRALESPDQSQRRATLYWGNPVRLKLTFPTAYSGTLHVYALDWDNLGRRQSVAVSNGSTTQTINITGPFTTGAWLHFPVSVPAGGSLTITATKSAGPNAVLSGLFLGSGGPPLPPPPPPFDVAPQGDWVGAYGSGGYVLGAWNGTSGDLLSLPAGVGYAVELGTRATWNANTSDVRALESPDQSQRRATLYWGNPVRLKLTFPTAYSGTLHVYALDWDNLGRRQSVAVSNGSTTQTINITGPFTTGAWLHFPVSVPAGGSLTITATKSAGPNAVLSGLFLN